MGGNFTSNLHKPHGIFYLETNSKSPFAIENYNSFRNIKIITNNGTTKRNGHDKPIVAKGHEEINEPQKGTEEKEEIDPNERNDSNEKDEENKQNVVHNGDIERDGSANPLKGEEDSQDSKIIIEGNEQNILNEEIKSSDQTGQKKDQNDQSLEKDENKSNERLEIDDGEEKIQDKENEKQSIIDQNEALHGDDQNKTVEYIETNYTNDQNITNIQSEDEESIESVDPFEPIIQEKEIIQDEQGVSKGEDDIQTIEYEDMKQNKSAESESDYGYDQNDQNNQSGLNEQDIQNEPNNIGENKEQREDHREENIESSPTSNFLSIIVSNIMKFIHILIKCIYLLREFLSNLFFA